MILRVQLGIKLVIPHTFYIPVLILEVYNPYFIFRAVLQWH